MNTEQLNLILEDPLKLRYHDFDTINRSSTLAEPTDADQVVFQRALLLLEKALSHRQELVRLIGVEVSGLTGWSQQAHMFEGTNERLARLNQAIDRIRLKYGFTSIQTGRAYALKDIYSRDRKGYRLNTPSLSR